MNFSPHKEESEDTDGSLKCADTHLYAIMVNCGKQWNSRSIGAISEETGSTGEKRLLEIFITQMQLPENIQIKNAWEKIRTFAHFMGFYIALYWLCELITGSRCKAMSSSLMWLENDNYYWKQWIQLPALHIHIRSLKSEYKSSPFGHYRFCFRY